MFTPKHVTVKAGMLPHSNMVLYDSKLVITLLTPMLYTEDNLTSFFTAVTAFLVLQSMNSGRSVMLRCERANEGGGGGGEDGKG